MKDETSRLAVSLLAVLLAIGSFGRTITTGFARPAESLAEPRLFGEGVISTMDDEAGITFTPDGRTAYFTKISPGTISPQLQVICVTHFQNGRWSAPGIAPFSGQYRDAFPFVSRDGSKFFFSSLRPVDGTPKRDMDIWVMDKTGDGWSEPRNLGVPVNGPGHDISPTLTADGTLYFASVRPGGKFPGVPEIFRSRFIEGKYAEPEELGDAINTADGAIDPLIAPDESFLVFVSSHADELLGIHRAYTRGDLYISYRKDGAWTPARNLGAPINSGGAECCAGLSPDGKYFFFTSDRGFATYRLQKRLTYGELMANLKRTLNGRGNIYQIDVKALSPAPPTPAGGTQ